MRLLVRALALGPLWLAAGCLGGGPPPEFYALRATAQPAAASAPASSSSLGIVVGPIEIPRYLDRSEIVTVDGAHRLDVWDEHRWGGSLRTDMLRAMSDDLGTLLRTTRVAVYPAEPPFPVQHQVLVDVLVFDGALGGAVVLHARWGIVSSAAGAAPVLEDFRIEQPVASPSFEDLVAAQSAALGALTREVAARIAALPTR
jgi:uncharacterized lipoprotein YmbA